MPIHMSNSNVQPILIHDFLMLETYSSTSFLEYGTSIVQRVE